MYSVLHIAPENIAGVPYSFYDMYKKMGHTSRLVTFHRNPFGLPEDICLDFYLPKNNLAGKWRKKKVAERQEEISRSTQAIEFKPRNIPESIFFGIRDFLRRREVVKVIRENSLGNYDLIFYHGGLDFFRYPSQATEWKRQGKKLISFYHGSDLRIRGYIKELDAITDLNLTSEYDLLTMKAGLEYCFYPYDPSELPQRKVNYSGKVKIVHSPTNRRYKGTELILGVIERLKNERDIEFFLIEGKPRAEVLEIKAGCDICIDQVGGNMGGTGYGKSGLESLALGLPTLTNMTEDYKNWLPENPFVLCNNADELYANLKLLIDDRDRRERLGKLGKEWVIKYHGYESVYKNITELFQRKGII